MLRILLIMTLCLCGCKPAPSQIENVEEYNKTQKEAEENIRLYRQGFIRYNNPDYECPKCRISLNMIEVITGRPLITEDMVANKATGQDGNLWTCPKCSVVYYKVKKDNANIVK